MSSKLLICLLDDQTLDQYFSGSNVPGIHMHKTIPFFVDFEPVLDQDGKVNGTTRNFVTWMILPKAVWVSHGPSFSHVHSRGTEPV
jgi:hypothetical protein